MKAWQVACSITSIDDNETKTLKLEKAQLTVGYEPFDRIVKGQTASVYVSAVDANAGNPVNGLPVLFDGKEVGKTGQLFDYTPDKSSAKTVNGQVLGAPAYLDAAFSINLKERMKPTPPPTASSSRLRTTVGPYYLPNYNPNGAVAVLKKVVLTFRPRWNPSLSQTVTLDEKAINGAGLLESRLTFPSGPGNIGDIDVSAEVTFSPVAYEYMGLPLYGNDVTVSDNQVAGWDGSNWHIGWYAWLDIVNFTTIVPRIKWTYGEKE